MSPTIVPLDSPAAAKDYGLVLGGKPVLGSGKLGFEPPVRFQALECRQGLKIGAYSFIRGAYVAGGPKVGRYCSIGANFSIGEPNHPLDWMSTASFQYRSSKFKFYEPMSDFVPLPEPDLTKGRGPASVGNDVWIGSNVMILHGVKVGDGAVIAAGAVVISDVAPYTIVGGVPAKKIRNRFADPAIAAELRRSKWWQFMAPDLTNIPFDKPMEALKEVLRREKAGEIHRFRPIFRVMRASGKGFELVIYTEREAERRIAHLT